MTPPMARARRAALALRIWLRLGRGERSAFARAFAAQLACGLRARIAPRLGEPWLPGDAALEPAVGPPRGPEPDERLLELFRLAESFQPIALACLPRALALGRFLGHHGFDTRLVLGVRRGPSGVEGHAWREWGDRVLEDDVFVRSFRPLLAAPPHARHEEEIR